MGIEPGEDPAVRRILADCTDAIGSLDMAGRRSVLRRLAAALLPSEEAREIVPERPQQQEKQKKNRRR